MTNNGSSECRNCKATIYWHKSKEGKPYPTDSATDRRAFHKCTETAPPKPSPQPIRPDYFSASVEERVAALETQVAQLTRTLRAVEQRQPITDSDIPF